MAKIQKYNGGGWKATWDNFFRGQHSYGIATELENGEVRIAKNTREFQGMLGTRKGYSKAKTAIFLSVIRGSFFYQKKEDDGTLTREIILVGQKNPALYGGSDASAIVKLDLNNSFAQSLVGDAFADASKTNSVRGTGYKESLIFHNGDTKEFLIQYGYFYLFQYVGDRARTPYAVTFYDEIVENYGGGYTYTNKYLFETAINGSSLVYVDFEIKTKPSTGRLFVEFHDETNSIIKSETIENSEMSSGGSVRIEAGLEAGEWHHMHVYSEYGDGEFWASSTNEGDSGAVPPWQGSNPAIDAYIKGSRKTGKAEIQNDVFMAKNDVFLVGRDGKVFYSDVDGVFDIANYEPVSPQDFSEMMGLIEHGDGVFVIKEDKKFGISPDTSGGTFGLSSNEIVDSSSGAIAKGSIAAANEGAVFYLSGEGIVSYGVSENYPLMRMSKSISLKIKDVIYQINLNAKTRIESTYFKGSYYLAYPKNSDDFNSELIVYDQTKKSYLIWTLPLGCFIPIGQDLYFTEANGNDLYKFDESDTDNGEAIHCLIESSHIAPGNKSRLMELEFELYLKENSTGIITLFADDNSHSFSETMETADVPGEKSVDIYHDFGSGYETYYRRKKKIIVPADINEGEEFFWKFETNSELNGGHSGFVKSVQISGKEFNPPKI